MKSNAEIRTAAKLSGIHFWQIADSLGMQDSAFSRKLRKELSNDEKSEILGIIEQLSREAG